MLKFYRICPVNTCGIIIVKIVSRRSAATEGLQELTVEMGGLHSTVTGDHCRLPCSSTVNLETEMANPDHLEKLEENVDPGIVANVKAVIKWIDNGDVIPNAHRGPRHLANDLLAKQLFEDVVLPICTAKLSHKNAKKFNENKLSRLVIYFADSTPELDQLIAAGNREMMEAFERFNMGAHEIAEIASLYAPDDQMQAKRIENLLGGLDLSTLHITALPEGTRFKPRLPVVAVDGSELLIRLIRPTLRYHFAKAIKIASFAGWIRRKIGSCKLVLQARGDESESQITSLYVMVANWAGTTSSAAAKRFKIPHFSLEFHPDIARNIAEVCKTEAFAKAVEGFISDLEDLMLCEESAPTTDVLQRMLQHARNPTSRFIPINSSMDLNGFGGLLLGMLEHGTKDLFSLLITDNFESVYDTSTDLFNTIYKKYPAMKPIQAVAQVPNMEVLTPNISNLYGVVLVGESCVLVKVNSNNYMWNRNCKTVAKYDTNLDGLDQLMLQSGDVWRIKNSKGKHTAYHVTSVGHKLEKGPIDAYSIDGSEVRLDGAFISKLTYEINMDEHELHCANTPTVLAKKMESEERLTNTNAQITYWFAKKALV